MTKIEPIKPWHIELLNSEGHIPPEVYSEHYAEALAEGGGITLIVDGRVRGAGGIIPQWKGVGTAWSIVTPWMREHPITMVKVFRAFLSRPTNYHRVQMTVVEGFEKAEAFAEFLGFTPEGKMMYYSPTGETHTLYARTRPWQ